MSLGSSAPGSATYIAHSDPTSDQHAQALSAELVLGVRSPIGTLQYWVRAKMLKVLKRGC